MALARGYAMARHRLALVKDSFKQEIYFNGNIFENKYSCCSKVSLYI